ncbi:MAG: hypothetical protein J5J06_05295 [Phycisphaerae bacterium]|nr:hypothetical protein [Phycisphaerae bacterium]
MSVRLAVHSREEARLYLAVTPCARCNQGPHEVVELEPPPPLSEGDEFDLYLICAHCGADRREVFVLRSGPGTAATADSPTSINPSDEPSNVIDAPGWLTLYGVYIDASAAETMARRRRSLLIRAGECLAEALKFYGDGEQPPAAAAFDTRSRQAMERNPAAFARRRLIELRAKLPHAMGDGRGS